MTMINIDPPAVQRQVVVLVDDDRAILSSLQRLCCNESYDVLATEEPQEALEWIQTRDVGVLLADDRMPVMSGTNLFYLAKVHSPTTARIMVTGFPGESNILHARAEGLFQVFPKPWDGNELKRVIRERLRERELEGMLPVKARSPERLRVNPGDQISRQIRR